MQTFAQIITKIVDFFYRPFRKYVPQQLFRYAACGGGNMVLDWVLYFVFYNFVVGHELVCGDSLSNSLGDTQVLQEMLTQKFLGSYLLHFADDSRP